jgi:predicted RNA-binding protein YlxR (DUF448 family)
VEHSAAPRSPLRTCVGCRVRAGKSDLLRVVAVENGAEPARVAVLTPDRHDRLPGRGAYLHLDLRCLDLAERRRAFRRALRLQGPPDLTVLRQWVEKQVAAARDLPAATDRNKEI